MAKVFGKLLRSHRNKATRFILNTWPPLFAQGIKVTNINPSMTRMDVRIKSRFYNQSALAAIFGGSLYCMTEPFYSLLFLAHIGRDHYVADKSASIEFMSPGRKTVNVTYEITPAQIQDVVERCKDGAPVLKTFNVDLIDTSGELVAQVEKVVYIRKKMKKSNNKNDNQV